MINQTVCSRIHLWGDADGGHDRPGFGTAADGRIQGHQGALEGHVPLRHGVSDGRVRSVHHRGGDGDPQGSMASHRARDRAGELDLAAGIGDRRAALRADCGYVRPQVRVRVRVPGALGGRAVERVLAGYRVADCLPLHFRGGDRRRLSGKRDDHERVCGEGVARNADQPGLFDAGRGFDSGSAAGIGAAGHIAFARMGLADSAGSGRDSAADRVPRTADDSRDAALPAGGGQARRVRAGFAGHLR